ncbi:hypothetical protein T492DRAFT_835831 [Pavlovales sp. CCMP2436]|nr:hypothetical protein T492DRAFT_835831 [Pavlovales sp. CCMP2436]
MGVVFPLVAPLAASPLVGITIIIIFLDKTQSPHHHHDHNATVNNCFSAILCSSLLGNICSPIADTTIMTSLSTKIFVPAHVAGINPYTALVGAVAVGAKLLLSLGLVGPAGTTFCSLAALGVASTRFRSAEPPKPRSA